MFCSVRAATSFFKSSRAKEQNPLPALIRPRTALNRASRNPDNPSQWVYLGILFGEEGGRGGGRQDVSSRRKTLRRGRHHNDGIPRAAARRFVGLGPIKAKTTHPKL